MKKVFIFLLLCLIAYTSYLDLSKGTLHLHDAKNKDAVPPIPYEEITVHPGETVLSVLERTHGTLPVSIDQALQDFAALNPEIDPMMIEAGNSYKFPLYDNGSN